MSALPAFEHEEATIAGLQAAMASGALTSRAITEAYLERIEAVDPLLGSVLQTNPDALEIADALDAERRDGEARGPLHGHGMPFEEPVGAGGLEPPTARL